jgi:hypothetical protein
VGSADIEGLPVLGLLQRTLHDFKRLREVFVHRFALEPALTLAASLPSTAGRRNLDEVTCMSKLLRFTAASAAAIITFAIAVPAHAQLPVDDQRVRQLESDLLRLQRMVDDQARRIQYLEQSMQIVSPPSASLLPAPLAPQNSSPAWLVSASWDRIKRGMTPQQVMAVLGRPTSTRNAEDGKLRLLYYAMELGPDTYLTGSIRVDDSGVVEINRPELK